MTSRGVCLVIEDDEDIGDLLEAILAAAGFEVRVEVSGTGGLSAAAGLELTLITLDLGLPDLDGRDVARKLREISGAPILMITAHAQPGDELDGMSAGASAYLTPPRSESSSKNSAHSRHPPYGPKRPSTTP